MTNEEAIFCERSYLGETNCRACAYYGTDTCKSRETHKMAIKALQIKPYEDAISKTIIKALENLLTECGNIWYFHVDDNDYQLTQLINELKNETEAGKKFQKNVCSLITVYLMKFGGKE